MKKNRNIPWYKTLEFRFWVKILLLFFLSILLFPIVTFLFFKIVNESIIETGQLGDTFGGLMGPFIAMIASFLTFIAFYVQFHANEQQKEDLLIERFENKFYEMLRLHRANIDETKIVGLFDIERRKAYVSMFNELRFLYFKCEQLYYELLNEGEIKEIKIDSLELKLTLLKMAYTFFYVGVGNNSDHIHKKVLEKVEPNFYEKVNDRLKDIKERHKENNYLTSVKSLDGETIDLNVKYLPFGGHMSRLGHYYRHLYQTLKFVDTNEVLEEEEKYSYIKILRAQLSDHEQALLYYNVVSTFGWRWIEEDKNYLINYRVIHNCPLPLINFGVSPKEHQVINRYIKDWEVKHKKPFFEWDE